MMTSRPFSVLLSLYAREHADWFAACLCSLYRQTVQADEIILVLDGPVGAELQKVIDDFQSRLPLKIISLPKNLGLGHALNQGLQYCRHEWIMRMDTDDVSIPERFAQQWQYIEQNPDVAVFSAQVAEFITDAAQPERLKSVPLNPTAIRDYAQWRNPINHMAVVYRKSVVLAVGSYCHHQGMEDYNLWLRILAGGYIVHNMANVLVHVRAGHDLYDRRRGWQYIRSEWQLLQLKRKLKIQACLPAFSCFILRSGSRLLSARLLRSLYQHLRQNINKSL